MADRDQIVAEIPRLRRYARALVGDAARADDLVQDTLERALSRWHLWRAGSNLRAWLFAIMHNLFVNQLKGAQRIEYVGDDPLPETPVRPEQGDALEVLDLAAALQKLPPQQREVMLLIGLEELSYEEAAKALDVPIGTVMSRLSRGRERLRALLAGEDVRQLKVVK